MRHSPSEKLEIIRIVEDSELSVRRTLKEMGIHRSTFYNWYRRYQEDGFEVLGPKKPKARTFWNKIPEEVKEQVVCEALEQTELSPRELACRIIDTKEYFISESSVYRILKSHDLITSPAYILMQAGHLKTRLVTFMSYGRQILLTSESLAGVGITCLPLWTTTLGLLWPGVRVARCRPGMSRIHWTKPWSSPGWIRFASNTNPDYSVTTGLRMSLLS